MGFQNFLCYQNVRRPLACDSEPGPGVPICSRSQVLELKISPGLEFTEEINRFWKGLSEAESSILAQPLPCCVSLAVPLPSSAEFSIRRLKMLLVTSWTSQVCCRSWGFRESDGGHQGSPCGHAGWEGRGERDDSRPGLGPSGFVSGSCALSPGAPSCCWRRERL